MATQSEYAVARRTYDLIQFGFDELPPRGRVRSFDVDYAHLRTADGGDLYVTRYGWPVVLSLMPEHWYHNRRYSQQGEKLPGGTGAVYRVPLRGRRDRSLDVVVKFSRVGQEVPLEIATSFLDSVSPVDIANARFNSPFEEFGLVMEMRRNAYGPPDVRLLAQQPLAIYAPAQQFELWRLGRSKGRFAQHQRQLREDQKETGDEDAALELDIKREYVLLYSWIKGLNAEQQLDAGVISQDEFEQLTPRVFEEMNAKGWRVLDNKPKHFILRRRRGRDEPLRRDGELVYALVDFELLERTREYRKTYRSSQRVRYWQMQHHREDDVHPALPPHLTSVDILGVHHVYGTAPNGGKIWAVGNDAELFDYFLPDRWRRTPRVKLSPSREVYRTRTRDNIHMVYRASRVGAKPHVDPFYSQGRRIRAYGYNSPFEEVAIATHLRRAGIPTVYPRAIYRTGHESINAHYLVDNRRYQSHSGLRTPDDPPEPLLTPDHDYFTIWGYYRGLDPMKDHAGEGQWGVVDFEQAREEGMITENEYHRLLERTARRMAELGIRVSRLDPCEFLLSFNRGRELRTDENGKLDVRFCMDALRAYDTGLLSEQAYLAIIENMAAALESVGFESLDLGGDHMLLSGNLRGEFERDVEGRPTATLCNFELVRMKYCPLHGPACCLLPG